MARQYEIGAQTEACFTTCVCETTPGCVIGYSSMRTRHTNMARLRDARTTRAGCVNGLRGRGTQTWHTCRDAVNDTSGAHTVCVVVCVHRGCVS
eukprot:4479204-Prymnesium_polylepis.1